MTARPSITFLLGATAVGKSALAMRLARRDGAAILSLDAMQVYRGANIGTGKPIAVEREEVPHGGLDLAEVGEAFDVANYLQHASDFIRGQREAGRPIIAVGGTGFYFRALTRGLCDAPPTPPALRTELDALGIDALRVRLARVDAVILPHLDASNPRRLARAIAVMETTGRSLLAWQKETSAPMVADFRAFWLQRERSELSARIESRVDAMLADGWREEVRRLVEQYGSRAIAKFPALGYRQLAEVVNGEKSLTQARADIVTTTRQYAKRQLTWFAREPSLREVMLSGSTVPAELDLSN